MKALCLDCEKAVDRMRELFHIHTYRCGHAENILDEQYILKAIELEADSITFTDHAPFPYDIFGGRMKYRELPEYISSITELKDKYKEQIIIKLGLEIEYLPSFYEYYQELSKIKEIDLLMIGQHFYEVEPGKYSFSFPELQSREHIGCINAIIEGIDTGLFEVVAHPDRAFRRISKWDEVCNSLSKTMANKALEKNVLLEFNLASKEKNNCWWPEFWEMIDSKNKIIEGLDAHYLKELERKIIIGIERKRLR